MRTEISHLRRLAFITTDAIVLAEIKALIHELERRMGHSGNGHDVG